MATKLTSKTEDYDFGLLRSFIGLFPESPLTQLLRSYFAYMSIPLTDAEEEEEEQAREDTDEEPDHIDAMMVRQVQRSTRRAY